MALRQPLQRTFSQIKSNVFRRFASQTPKPVDNSYRSTKYTLAVLLSIGAGLGLHSFARSEFYQSILRELQPEEQPELQALSYSNIDNSLRSRFNFIDKVVKKCASSVVYIEIRDPTRMDPETGLPLTASNGSGFIVGEDGWILTNAHVVINRPQAMIMVMLDDGSRFQASVEDADMNMDLALLKIHTNEKLPYLQLGKSADVVTGEWVIALGSPLSLSHSVTAGVVSSVNRGAEELGLRNFSMHYIQTDAAITFGNSGGPLVNLDGDVIGINNLRVTAGIAFAIPVDYAKKFLERSYYASKEKATKVSGIDDSNILGITTISVSPKIIGELLQIHESIPEEDMKGVLIWKIIHGMPAQKSGLEAGDIITHIDDIPVHGASDIYAVTNLSARNLKVAVLHLGMKKEIVIKRNRLVN